MDSVKTMEHSVVANIGTATATVVPIMNTDSQENNLMVLRRGTCQTPITIIGRDAGTKLDQDFAAIMAHLVTANSSTAKAASLPIVTTNSKDDSLVV